MTLFYKDDAVKLFNADCISGMKELDKDIGDILITSPPYAVGKEYEKDQSYGDYLKLISEKCQSC